ncbi:MAG: hypothetical protein UV78_C0038G0003 [Parcubacteria group bacterium GW2011_GWA2_43_17]|nr:MAG: hypothetical protein UV78_C0038G0003 [Parcubacteria group bacterium GW2011_GWA2_43_17]KKT92338.1 MAG: hypothetical protein UW91_C0023G0019 [Parcubacteria group bacterium GW2011_GWF2_45_11]KKT97333.1 MAG: hypothetical protein UW98_C0019G0009 [Parcubacteria group bacterium GW2011_GWC2_45_15]OGY92990.1 MAG: hypothetical protein A2260_03900 [Candidatus Komeilibacteria bacterium RIFOXYA2_FULL_45_9]OGY96243.1 MAG: hypothetical protein A3J95_04275 [Candidatus Komeilibacteria bacterium RIFOXYC2
MRFHINRDKLISNLRDLLRRCGYFGIEDKRSGRLSYVRRLSKIQHYPRFHLYIEEQSDRLIFNLHLDQKQVSYQGQKAHSGDYDEPAVQAEAARIQSLI